MTGTRITSTFSVGNNQLIFIRAASRYAAKIFARRHNLHPNQWLHLALPSALIGREFYAVVELKGYEKHPMSEAIDEMLIARMDAPSTKIAVLEEKYLLPTQFKGSQ